jgi:transposase
LDVHNDAIAVAYGSEAGEAEGVCLGRIGTRPCDIDTRIHTLASNAPPLVVVDEAGPRGPWLYRDLTQKTRICWVVAPALVPKKAGDRVNTDRREATQLARLSCSGALTPVYVPEVEDEALRDLRRARAEALRERKPAKDRLQAFLRRQESRYACRATWGPAYRCRLAAVVCPPPAQPIIVQEYVRAVAAHQARLQRLEADRREQVHVWRLFPVVPALQAMRGVQFTVAVTLMAELGDLSRVDRPRQRMRYLGRTPSESSSGARRRPGRMTKAGNPFARRALIEGAWSSRDPAKVSRQLPWRLEQLPPAIQRTGWRAPGRRCTRCRSLTARGTHANQVVVAIARALAAFIGAVAREVQLTREAPHPLTVNPSPIGATPRRSDERPPRFGAILGGVTRRQETRVPRARPAPDGPTSGGRPPTDSSLINRRDDGLPLCRWSAYPK